MHLKAIDSYDTLDTTTNANLQQTDRVLFNDPTKGTRILAVSELDKRYVSQPTGGSGASRVAGGSHVPTSGEVSGTTLTIATGLTSIASVHVQAVTTSTGAELAVTGALVTISGGSITIANGGSFTLATTQTLYWQAVGA